MTDLTIRKMKPEDRPAVVALLLDSEPWKWLGYTAADWEQYFAPIPQGRDSYVADLDRNVAGIAVVRQKFLLGDYLELFGVASGVRGKGLGKLLLAHVESIVFARAKNLFACVSDFNEGARRFYSKQGYQEIGSMPNFLIPGSAEILLRKTTGPARTTQI